MSSLGIGTQTALAPEPEGPNFLIEWEPRWQSFKESVAPAMERSPAHLAGELKPGLFPVHGMVTTWLLEFALLLALIMIPSTLQHMGLFLPPPMPKPKYDVIYFSGDELPRVSDAGGAEAGHSGRSGGREHYSKKQVIKVARGDSLVDKVVDAPKLKLPHSNEPVKNLLAVTAAQPGPAPTQGLRSTALVRPPDPAVVPPQPEVRRDRLPAAQALSATVIQPTPDARREIARARLPQLDGNDVIPPPVAVPSNESVAPKLTLPATAVVQPPPQVDRALWGTAHPLPGTTDKAGVIPPPVQAIGHGLGRSTRAIGTVGGGTEVIAPPPNALAGNAGLTSGVGNGLGKELASLGNNVAGPPGAGSSGTVNGGVVISNSPGSKVGIGQGGAGSLAMSPNGGAKAGLGGSGGGAGIGNGNGPGSGKVGEGSGGANTGTGFGSSLTAHGGTSNGPGPGGAGTGKGAGGPMMAGISIQGGTVTLPSFATGSDDDPSAPGHTPSQRGIHKPAITVIATSRSGGAMREYGALKGSKVYTIYLDTKAGPAVLQFADSSKTGGFDEDLVPPEAISDELPEGIKPSRLVISCVMDRSGILRHVKVLEGAGSAQSSQVLEAVLNWRFRPALRGNDPIEVNAILGFAVDTKDIR
ncbi:MAG TPA: hypothetical protein VFA04_11925 [Bryobacteraceae bacterium]|nr:hypothetical protein [Bryobacteraceae bacterium]